MTNLNDYRNIDDNMIWKKSALSQIDAFESLAKALDEDITAIGSHTSKSVKLPVVQIKIGDNTFVLRDNFYDINLYAQLKEPLNLSLEDFFEAILEPRDWDWYLAEIKKCRDYSYRGWSDKEMNDPNILRAEGTWSWDHPVSPEEKLSWADRMSNPSWYKDWAGNELTWEGAFCRPGIKMFQQRKPFAQGIVLSPGIPECYMPGSNAFIICLNSLEQAETVIKRIL